MGWFSLASGSLYRWEKKHRLSSYLQPAQGEGGGGRVCLEPGRAQARPRAPQYWQGSL